MENLLDGQDFQNIAEGLQETSGLTDRTLQIKRNSGFTGGTYDGVAPSPTFTYFTFMGTVEGVTQKEAVNSGGMLSLGDLTVTTTVGAQFKQEGGDGYTIQQGDILIYEGLEFYMVGVPFREFVAGGVAFTRSYWRRT